MKLLPARLGEALGMLSHGQGEKISNGWVPNNTDINEYDTLT